MGTVKGGPAVVEGAEGGVVCKMSGLVEKIRQEMGIVNIMGDRGVGETIMVWACERKGKGGWLGGCVDVGIESGSIGRCPTGADP